MKQNDYYKPSVNVRNNINIRNTAATFTLTGHPPVAKYVLESGPWGSDLWCGVLDPLGTDFRLLQHPHLISFQASLLKYISRLPAFLSSHPPVVFL